MNTRPANHRSGFTLIELLVAMTIGLFLIIGSITLYTQGRRTYEIAERIAGIQETVAFALAALEPDLRMAGFWGRHANGVSIRVDPNIAVACDGRDVTAWALNLSEPVAAANNRYDLPCDVFAAAQPQTDTLTVRRAGSHPALPRTRRIQLQSDYGGGVLFSDGQVPASSPASSVTHDVLVHAYYIDRRSSLGAVPSLRRQTLTTGGLVANQEIIPGVEDLQVRLGIDSDRDAVPDRFVDPGDPALGTDTAIVAVRLLLRVRATEPDPGSNNAFASRELTRTVYLRNHGPDG